jgi:predicted regulator of Ras-like GTPase activity (Roadblock/LC7/MglB family)
MDAVQALADLTEISAQIQAAVLADGDGSVLASTFKESGRAEEVARAAIELLAAADEARKGRAQALVQLQAATPEGSVFVVRDDNRAVAAVTKADPTAGLVFYDLKTCLRFLEQDQKSEAATVSKPAVPKRKKKEETEEKTGGA